MIQHVAGADQVPRSAKGAIRRAPDIWEKWLAIYEGMSDPEYEPLAEDWGAFYALYLKLRRLGVPYAESFCQHVEEINRSLLRGDEDSDEDVDEDDRQGDSVHEFEGDSAEEFQAGDDDEPRDVPVHSLGSGCLLDADSFLAVAEVWETQAAIDNAASLPAIISIFDAA